jgi:RHH-type proline utilization regulon transcriptional repressor/proline dehydrogenase/delta 1-pyrroline-5-carboxylate dehydrogenase
VRFDPALRGWNGIGFVIQAYQKRCPFVIDWLIDLARRSRPPADGPPGQGRLLGQRNQARPGRRPGGLPGLHPQAHTDVSYLACARKLLAAPDAIYPQFATHNAHTLAAIYRWPGRTTTPGQYEFQCLHGMGEPLYEQVVGPVPTGKLGAPAASTRRWARTRPCWPTWCAACWKTAPTPPSSTASPTKPSSLTTW